MTESTNSAPKRGVPIWVQVIIWIFLVGLLALVALGLKQAQNKTVTVQPGTKIENFTVPMYDDYQYNGMSQVSLQDLRGKVVVINFWASWCKPCEQEAADLESAWLLYQPRQDVVFLGVDWTDTEKKGLEYLEKFGITYPNGPDLGTRISQAYRITGVPETYIIDRSGILVSRKLSPFLSLEEIQNAVDPLLAE